jgi:hypothetical protein
MTAVQRRERIEAVIARGDIAELLRIIEFGPCGCIGARNGEPLCSCRMNSKQIRDAVSYAGLRHGKLIRLRGAPL